MNYKKKKNQSHKLNKNYHTIKITTHSILLKIIRKKMIIILNLHKNFNMRLILFTLKKFD